MRTEADRLVRHWQTAFEVAQLGEIQAHQAEPEGVARVQIDGPLSLLGGAVMVTMEEE